MCRPKEPRYFTLPEEAYTEKWGWYQGLFSSVPPTARAVGEGSQVYTARPLEGAWEAPRRIAERCPDARLIYLVREPIARLESGWRMAARDHPGEFSDFNQDITSARYRHLFIERSCYAFQLDAYREHFADERICVLFHDEFESHPLGVLARCTEFLGLSRFAGYRGLERRMNSAEGTAGGVRGRLRALIGRGRRVVPRPEWLPETRAAVEAIVSPDTARFLAFAGRPEKWGGSPVSPSGTD